MFLLITYVTAMYTPPILSSMCGTHSTIEDIPGFKSLLETDVAGAKGCRVHFPDGTSQLIHCLLAVYPRDGWLGIEFQCSNVTAVFSCGLGTYMENKYKWFRSPLSLNDTEYMMRAMDQTCLAVDGSPIYFNQIFEAEPHPNVEVRKVDDKCAIKSKIKANGGMAYAAVVVGYTGGKAFFHLGNQRMRVALEVPSDWDVEDAAGSSIAIIVGIVVLLILLLMCAAAAFVFMRMKNKPTGDDEGQVEERKHKGGKRGGGGSSMSKSSANVGKSGSMGRSQQGGVNSSKK